jgi:hypothetical protein
MLSSDENKAGGKPRKGKPAQGGRQRKAKAPQDMQPDRLPDAVEETVAPAALAESSVAPNFIAETAPPPAETQAAPVNYRTLADAYGDYSRTSFDQARSFFEQLAGVRSFDKALALQTAYAREAYENFAAQSERIRELHRQMARQRWQRLEGLMTGRAKV